jgi:preprotein translocase subunit YajC
MHSAHAVITALLAASSSSTKTKSNALVSLLPLILIFGLAYFFFLRPRSQAARRQRETIMEINAGDEVLTGAGIFGRVLDVEGDRVTIETAPGTRITILRSTIARKLTEPVDDDTDWQDDDHDGYEQHDQHEYDEHDEHDHEHDDAHHGADEHHGGDTSLTDGSHTDKDPPGDGEPGKGRARGEDHA